MGEFLLLPKILKKLTKIVAIILIGIQLLVAFAKWNQGKKLFMDYVGYDAQPQPLTLGPRDHSLPMTSPFLMDTADDGAISSAALEGTKTLRNFTIVTAYFNIGEITKGIISRKRNSSTYIQWMQPYRLIQNGVVAYFDDAGIAAAFEKLRRGLPTKVVMVDKSKLWAFSLLNRTRVVFSNPDYPKNHPKSTNPEYVSAMHSKYELLLRAVREDDPFGSSYIAWMDLGIYRELPSNANSSFMLRASGCLHDEAVMFARIFPMGHGYTLPWVMRYGHDWVGGGFFVARRDVMTYFCAEYVQRVETYLNYRLANHDQSVLLAMYLPLSAPRPSVPLQAMLPSEGDDPWFSMALQCRREALETPSDNMQSANSENSASTARRMSCTYEIYT